MDLIIEKLNNKFELKESYVNYPLFMYILEKKVFASENVMSFDVWEYHLKDLSLPTLSNPKIQSILILVPPQNIRIKVFKEIDIKFRG